MKTARPGGNSGNLLTVLALAVAFWFAAGPANAETYTLRVDGLACPFCSYGIEKQLRKLAGVNEVITNIKNGTIQVKTDTGNKLSKVELEAAVKRSGFTLRSVN